MYGKHKRRAAGYIIPEESYVSDIISKHKIKLFQQIKLVSLRCVLASVIFVYGWMSESKVQTLDTQTKS